ncbi:unnamed protein product [Phytomonas sp. Hart1]|nr:unnamed protein product [Phytomonas sp. Hart1]|eukprot:CCW71225.1 unnamed protein product [Phytomonas sp. isolate Hart1]
MQNSISKQNDGKDASHLSKRKRRRKKTKSLYDQYFEDSAKKHLSTSCSDSDEVNSEIDWDFTVGMDINILLQQTIQNSIRSVCLEDYDGLSSFGDHELICFAASIKNNTSIVSLQIRYLNVSDVSLVSLCNALLNHPSLRALDLSGTRGGEATSSALCNLVCTNSSIIFVRVDDTIVNPKDNEIIQMATQYNAMICADPNSNPFQLGLLHKISFIEEKVQEYNQQLNARPWLLPEDGVKKNISDKSSLNSKKRVKLLTGRGMQFGAEVCTQFINGYCAYSSRCKYFHPEKTSALKNTTTINQNQSLIPDSHPSNSSIVLTTSSRHQSLQNRLKPPSFTLNHDSGSSRIKNNKLPSHNNTKKKESTVFTPAFFLLWTSCLSATICSIKCFSLYLWKDK